MKLHVLHYIKTHSRAKRRATMPHVRNEHLVVFPTFWQGRLRPNPVYARPQLLHTRYTRPSSSERCSARLPSARSSNSDRVTQRKFLACSPCRMRRSASNVCSRKPLSGMWTSRNGSALHLRQHCLHDKHWVLYGPIVAVDVHEDVPQTVLRDSGVGRLFL